MEKRKNIVIGIVILLVLVIGQKYLSDPVSTIKTAGDGTSLKEINKELKVTLQAGQTTEESLAQGMVIGNYNLKYNNFFIGSNFIGGVSNQFGVVTPVLCFNAGYNFGEYQLEYKVGKFKRSKITSVGTDPQQCNRYTVFGEGSTAANTMQLSFAKGGYRFGFGHQAEVDFYSLQGGSWYGFAELQPLSWLTLTGGADFSKDATTGYAAAKATSGDNTFVFTANKVGTESENYVVTYNRANIPVMGHKLSLTATAWNQTTFGAHLIAGFAKWGATFFTGGGYDKGFYGSVGTSVTF